jgi:hypothetical protein
MDFCVHCCHSSANHRLSPSHIGHIDQIASKRAVRVTFGRLLTFVKGITPKTGMMTVSEGGVAGMFPLVPSTKQVSSTTCSAR